MLDACQIGVDDDASAVLAHDHLLAHADVQLALRRYLVVAATACITVHRHDAQTVAAVVTDALEGTQQTRLYGALQVLGSLAQALFLCPGVGNNLVQLALLDIQVGATLVDECVAVGHLMSLALHECLGFAYTLLVELVVQFGILNLLGQVVILAVVSHAVHLSLVAGDIGIVDLDVLVHHSDITLDDLHLLANLLYSGGESLNLIFEVLHLARQLAAQSLHLVNLGQSGLQRIEVLEFLLHIDFCRILCLFLCHNYNLS